MYDTEGLAPRKKNCRASKKKRMRLRKRASAQAKGRAAADELQDAQSQAEEVIKSQDKKHDQHKIKEQDKKLQQQQNHQTQRQDQDEKQDGHRSGDAGQEKQVQVEMTEYERKRQENILRNQAFLQKVGVATAKFAARTTIGNEAEKEEKRKEMAARRALSAARKAELLSQPVRKSKRLESENVVKTRPLKRNSRSGVRSRGITGKEPAPQNAEQKKKNITSRTATGRTDKTIRWQELDPVDMDVDALSTEDESETQRRTSNKVRSTKRVLMDVGTQPDTSKLRVILEYENMSSDKAQAQLEAPVYQNETTEISPQENDDALPNDRSEEQRNGAMDEDKPFLDGDDVEYSLEGKDIGKAVPDPIRSMAFLPRADRIIVACGDKEGHVALLAPSNGASNSERDGFDSTAALLRPHGFAVSQLIFPDSTKLVSSSFDGTVCELDLWTLESSIVCDTGDGFGISAIAASGDPQFYYAGCDDGILRLIDRRARKLHGSSYALHDAKITTLDQHPSLDFCIATAARDRTVCLWDMRKISSEESVPLTKLRHRSPVNCAYFSPHDGALLLTAEEDPFFNMFSTARLTKRNALDTLPFRIPKPVRTYHRNRSASDAPLHPVWDPKRRNHFVIGCMYQPPRIQVFCAGYPQPVRHLISSNFTSVAPVNTFHPQSDLLASGHTSGRVSLWRGKTT